MNLVASLVLLCGLVVAVQSSSVGAQPGASCGGRPATIIGTDAPDVLRGTRGDDVIVAFGGNDRVSGGGGNDIVCAGPGNDRVTMGNGNDRVSGDDGNDRVVAGGGRDLVVGSGGDDQLTGGKGDDRLDGGAGDDEIGGGEGNDRIVGGSGFDSCGPASIPGREPGDVFGPSRAARACEVEEISLRQQSTRFDTQQWSVRSATASYESPSTFGDPDAAPVITQDRRLYVDLEVTSGRFQTVNYDQRHVFLRTRDGGLIGADGFVLSLTPGAAIEERISFRVPQSRSLTGAAIVLGPSSSERAVLPLAEPVPSERFPLAASVELARKQMQMGPCDNAIDVETLDAHWDLELPPEVSVSDIAAVESYRAAAGSRFLVVDLRFFGLTNFCGGTNIQSVDMRMESDGRPSAVRTFHNEVVTAGESLDLTAGFVVPVGADSVTLLIGKFGEQIAEFTVAVPDLAR